MAIQKVLQAQSPDLRKIVKSVLNFDKRIQKLINDLDQTLMAQNDPEGVGLAAPQIGVSSRVFILKPESKLQVFINPEITWMSEETNDPVNKNIKHKAKSRRHKQSLPFHGKKDQSLITNHESPEYIMEGCLSLPHYYGPVKRAKSIKVRYERPELVNDQWLMVDREEELSGLPAQIVQHEVDHLNGKLFIDHLIEQNRKLYYWNGKDWEEVELP